MQPKRSKNLLIGTFVAVFFSMLVEGMADYKQAVIYYNRGLYDKAIQEIKPDVESDQNWEPGHRILGLCYVKTKRYELAIAELTKAVQLKSPVFSTYMGLAEAYWSQNKLNNTTEILKVGEKLAKTPDERYGLYHLRGAAYFRQKKYSDAAHDLTEAIRIKSSDPADFSQLGVSYYFLGKYEDAIAALNKATSMKPGDQTSTEFLARCYQKRGADLLRSKHYAAAVEDLNKALGYNPKDGTTYYNLGMAYIFVNKYDAAESALMKAAELLPDKAQAFQQLGFVYEKKKQYNKALDAYKRAYDLRKDPQVKASIERVNQAMGSSKSNP